MGIRGTMKIMDKTSDSNDSSVARVVGRKVLSRTLWLLIGALLGLALIGVLFFYLMPVFFEACIRGRTSYAIAVRLVPLVIMLVGSVPVTVLLWLFRTHDVTRQNELSRQSNDQSTFAHAMDLVLTGKPEARGVGLAILVQIFKLADEDLKDRAKPAVRNAFSIEEDGILMSYMKVEGINLEGGYFHKAKAELTKFFNCIMNNANFTFADLSGAQFFDSKLDGVDLSGAICDEISLVGTNMRESILGESPSIDREFSSLSIADIKKNESIMDAVDPGVKGPVFLESNWEEVNLTNACIFEINLARSTLNNVDMSLESDKGIAFRRVDFSDSFLSSVDFSDRVIVSVCFAQATLKNIQFTRTIMVLVDFKEATLEDVKFSKANLAGADLSLAVLKPHSIDFKEAILSEGDERVKLPYQSLQEALKEHPSLKHAKGEAQYLPPR